MWGLLVSVGTVIIAVVSPIVIPFQSLLIMIAVYFFYLKKKEVNLRFYLLGYFAILVAVLFVLGTAIFMVILFGVLA